MTKFIGTVLAAAIIVAGITAGIKMGVFAFQKLKTLEELAVEAETAKAEAAKKAFDDRYASKKVGPNMFRYIDPATGCHYLQSTGDKTLVPRMKADGTQMCEQP